MDPLSFARLDTDGALAETAERAGELSRGGFLAAALSGSAVLVGAVAAPAAGQKPGRDDQAILNFALTLEYLQSAFYTEAERLDALKGDARNAARRVGAVERAHVVAFRKLLGRTAVKRPNFDFQGTTEDQKGFLKTAVAFEDLAVAAYKGQATRLRSDSALAAAVSIHSVEARHAAWMRYLVGANPAANPFDEPKSRGQVTRLVRSTNFIAARPATKGKRAPRYTG